MHDKPILNTTGKGEPGCFDEFGTMPGSVLWREDIQEMWLYYVGWQRSNTLPYMWANGLAISKDRGVTFEKVREGPIVSSVYKYPYLHACPRVFNYGENNWFMWYASGVEWYECENRLNPIYVIMPAKSNDGLHWQLSEQPCIPPVYSKECQSGASVLEYGGLYHMFFSYRNVATLRDEQKQYRIGHAWSENLTDWHRDNSQAGLDVSLSGWDSEAVCYPHVVRVDDKTYMFYSGNKFGCSGFGYAELEG